METTTFFEENDEITTMNPNKEFTVITTTPVVNDISTTPSTTETNDMSPQQLYQKYANTEPPFPLFPNVSPPSFPNLSSAQQNACSTAEIDYTKQIKEAASYINQESFGLFGENNSGKLFGGGDGSGKVKVVGESKPANIQYDPIEQAGKVIQQALNVSNSNSLNCVCNNVAVSVSNNEDSSEAIEFDISDIKTTNFNLNIGQQSNNTTTVTNVLSENFTNTVNNTIKNNLNIFASQVNKVKNASPTGLGNSQKFFNAIQNSLMNVMNNNTVSNTANSQFTEKNNKISLTNITAKNINISDVQKTVTDTYVKNVTNAVTNNALKNIGINEEGITALSSNTDSNNNDLLKNNSGRDSGGEDKNEETFNSLYYLCLIPFFIIFFLGLFGGLYYIYKDKNTKDNTFLQTLYNPIRSIIIHFKLYISIITIGVFVMILYGFCLWSLLSVKNGKNIWIIPLITTICITIYIFLPYFTRSTIFFGITNTQAENDVEVIETDLNISGRNKNLSTE